ncbi:MAG: DNA mismatch repair protein MutT [Betaproteobacteria bacterium HGW-Betaproteobacteria-22]|nr:MAG: DNA mismatch repair protein MutT [Betaproteobacteria bacterium HGW-Betaproteobacteria-22]
MVAQNPVLNNALPEITEAAVGVLQRDNGMVLLAERPKGKPWAGYWEFPGGKIETDETPAQALKRELFEELGITITHFYAWLTRTYQYDAQYDAYGVLQSPAKTVKLHFFIVDEWQGDPVGMEDQATSWQNPENLTVDPMLPANQPILTALGLHPTYAITNLKEMGATLFFEHLKLALEHGLMMIQVREHYLSPQELKLFAEHVIELATPFDAKVFINGDVQLALELNAAGVHLPAHKLMQLTSRPEGLLCGASCHNQLELAYAEVLGFDYVTLSPVKPTMSHPDAQPLGWDVFGQLVTGYSLPVFALGGILREDLHTARSYGAHGVAMQRDIWGMV